MFGEETFHPDTRALLQFGRALDGGKKLPPGANPDRLAGRLLVFDRIHQGLGRERLHVRVFGAALETMFGRDWRGGDLLDLVPAEQQTAFVGLVVAVESSARAGVARLRCELERGAPGPEAELLLTPLPEPGFKRSLGLFSPLGETDGPIQRLRLVVSHLPEARMRFVPRLVVSND